MLCFFLFGTSCCCCCCFLFLCWKKLFIFGAGFWCAFSSFLFLYLYCCCCCLLGEKSIFSPLLDTKCWSFILLFFLFFLLLFSRSHSCWWLNEIYKIQIVNWTWKCPRWTYKHIFGQVFDCFSETINYFFFSNIYLIFQSFIVVSY